MDGAGLHAFVESLLQHYGAQGLHIRGGRVRTNGRPEQDSGEIRYQEE